MTDDELIAGLAARREGAVEALIAQHGGKIYGLALRMMGNEADAQEVAQEVLLTVYNKIASFQRQSALSSWIYRVTANAALMRLRQRKRQQVELSLEELTDPMGESSRILQDWRSIPSGEAMNDELRTRIETAIEGLPDEFRAVVVLKDVEGQSLEQIAAASGLTLAAIKSRLHRARLALRKELTRYFRDEKRKEQ